MSRGKALLRLLLGARRAEAIRVARIMRSPDRKLLLESYFPTFAAEKGRILWIGCQAYTAGYPALLEAAGAEVWTTDVDPAAEKWGRAGRHRTGDVRQADAVFLDLAFDAILCNGVLGFGVDSLSDQQQALDAMATLLRPGGRLLLGWNRGRIDDPVAGGLTKANYAPAAVGPMRTRVAVPGVTHMFDSLVRRSSPGRR